MGWINDFFLGRVVHEYKLIEVCHGPMTCRNRFLIREKKGVARLFNERVCTDRHDLRKSFHEYDLQDVAALCDIYAQAPEMIRRAESHEFEHALRRQDGGLSCRASFYVDTANETAYLYCREESQAHGSSHTSVTYFPLDEVLAIADVLDDAHARMTT